jgi:hypothetical protein
MTEQTPEEAQETPDDTSVETFADIEIEVNRHFDGNWKKFLLAVENPAEILHFVLSEHFDRDRAKFESWSKEQELPPDWVPRFYGTLTPEGELDEKHRSAPRADEAGGDQPAEDADPPN